MSWTWFVIGLLAIAAIIYFTANNSRAVVRNTEGTRLENTPVPPVATINNDIAEKAKVENHVSDFKSADVHEENNDEQR